MLNWLADKHDHPPTHEAIERIDRAVDKAFVSGIRPFDLGGRDGTAAVTKAVIGALD